ncbi:hypothetical protein [Pseudomonas sp.]|uniref:hypothetical protein n=1 Tax=Pseudomonas sp. TaxID=306 RepID=UPI003520BFBF
MLKDVAHLVDGMLHNGGMSSQVSKQVFEVGRNLAVTPGSVVLRHPLFELFQYALKNDLQVFVLSWRTPDACHMSGGCRIMCRPLREPSMPTGRLPLASWLLQLI